MSTTTTTATTRDRGDRYGPIEWAQLRVRIYRTTLAGWLIDMSAVLSQLVKSTSNGGERRRSRRQRALVV